MHCLPFLFVVTLVNVSCDVIHDDYGGDGDCQESPWLCRQLAEMRRVMAEQQRVIQQQSKRIDEQGSMIDVQNKQIVDLSSRVDQQGSMFVQQNNRITEQSSIIQHQSSVIDQLESKISKHDAVARQLSEEVETLKNRQQNDKKGAYSLFKACDTSMTSEQRDVVLRSDDGGPLEAVVNQLSQQLTTMSADIQAMKNTDQVLQTTNNQQDLNIQAMKNAEQVLQNANQQQDHDIQALKNSDTQQSLNIQDARTSTFVHWGSSHCPSDAQLVYSGVVGGSWYHYTGGGANYLCLTVTPVMSSLALPRYYTYLYGTEYQTYDSHLEKDAVCAVCRSSHSTTIMIPGTNVCTPGWTKQYDGFLMAEYQTNGASEFVCVDSAMESRPASDANEDGRQLYFTVTYCGSLPCEPYVNKMIVTCVVCSM